MADLLANRPVQARVAGMHACHVVTLGVGLADQLDDLFQVQFGTVDHLVRPVPLEHCFRHQ
ncbi:hypothetical protein D3C76_1657670 [compost metagenome]